MTTYQQFLESKRIVSRPAGMNPNEIHPALFPFQRDIVRWGLKLGRFAGWEDCGLGKSGQQCEWSHQASEHLKGDGLILAPLGVREQTARESEKLFGRSITVCDSDSDVRSGVNITNYHKLHKFDIKRFKSVALDESSILKSFDGKYRTELISGFKDTPFRSAWTATPCPNDYMEIGNHAEFLGIMKVSEMLSMFFVHDGGDTSQWRLKGHAESAFWKWVCSWAVFIRKPSDLGYPDDGFILPPLKINEVTVQGSAKSVGMLFQMPANSLTERRDARRGSIEERCAAAADIILKSEEQFLVWVGLDSEQDLMEKLLGDKCVSIRGSTKPDEKRVELNEKWVSGKVQTMITKGLIFGYGMNWQHCHNVIYVGLNDSQELFYQTVRREWRFGQIHPVNCWIITSDIEGNVVSNIKRKEINATRMAEEMVKHMSEINKENIKGIEQTKDDYTEGVAEGKRFKVYLGDCVEKMAEIADNSVGFTVYSPPFASLYTYSASDRDMGNCKDDDEFFKHYQFLASEILRVTQLGRLVSVHCMNLPTSKSRDGYIGIRDFRGDIIRAHIEAGFIYHSEVCIWKDPVTAMQRTKALGLLHKQMVKDSCMSRQGIPDYLVTFRKPGVNANPVEGELDRWIGDESFKSEGRLSIDLWQRYASPVWMDINPSRTLQKNSARDDADERHVCPLQLDVIERAIELWSNPGDLVLSPFTGIGSEGYVAVEKERRFVGIELKKSYFIQAVANLHNAENKPVEQPSLF